MSEPDFPSKRYSYTSTVASSSPSRITLMSRREPDSVTPPARYSALNTDENDDMRKVPGVSTSPMTLTLIVLILPSDTLTKVPGFSPPIPAYLVCSAALIFFSASFMVRPLRYTGPTMLMLIRPSGETVCVDMSSLRPQTSITTSSPGPSL